MTKGDATFIGVYGTDEEVLSGSYVLNADGFVKTESAASIAPFRAYITAKGSKSILGMTLDGVSTNIEDIEMELTVGRENIYNMAGQLIRANAAIAEDLPRGIYIFNGKKIVVK